MLRIASPFGVLPSALLLAGLLPSASPAPRAQTTDADALQPRGCATLVHAQRRLDAPAGAGRAAARAQAATLSGRTLATEHFAIHYTLAPNVHRARLEPSHAADVSLKATTDSLRAAVTGAMSAYRRDSTVHARLDSLGAGHPLYIERAAAYFEQAWSYYDSLGMVMPAYASVSSTYLLPSQGRYVVDIADVNTAGGFAGPYYGLSYPPGDGGRILLENDFLYSVTYHANGDSVSGTPVRAYYPDGATVHRNYDAQWEMGLRVTASHEFYHSVQYSYTPILNNIHAWYELSATGMEERLAPDVNDYFQYLRFSVPNQHASSGSLLAAQTNHNYGNATFHVFLTRALGEGFDRLVWEALDSVNTLENGLAGGAGSAARRDSLYAAYAAAMALSGTPGAAASPLAFSPDMAQWPAPRFDTVPATGTTQLSLPPLTFRLVRPPTEGTGLAGLSGIATGWRVDSTSAAGYRQTALDGAVLPVTDGPGSTRTAVAVANASFAQAAEVVLSKPGTLLAAGLNPVRRTQESLLFMAPLGGSSDSLRVSAESGRRVATLPADGSGAFWSWDLKDPQGRTVPPGLYFFGLPGQTPRALSILP